MTPALTWIVHDPDESDRINRILSALKQGEARDELGLGGIRDSLADALFPGTSTIQTRLRYFLIVAWCYRHVELQGVKAPRFGRAVADLERQLIPVLKVQDDADGVFGRVAGQAVKRLPSSVYWNGLGQWGIRRVPISQGVYHRTIDRYLDRARRVVQTDDGQALASMPKAIWHPNLPDPPPGFPDTVDFQLTPDEAGFLVDRVHDHAPGTLLDWLALRPEHAPDVQAAPFPWALPCHAALPPATRTLLHHARLVSELSHGAAQLYNLLVAQVDRPHSELDPTGRGPGAGESDRLDAILTARRQDLERWRQELQPRWADIDGWNQEQLRLLCEQSPGHQVTRRTWDFLAAWTDRVRATRGQVEGDAIASRLVRARERELKGRNGRSRFDNGTLRAQWAGEAGIGRLDFRWGPVQRLLRDLYSTTAREQAA